MAPHYCPDCGAVSAVCAPGVPTAAPARVDAEQLRQRLRDLPALPRAALDALAALRDDSTCSARCAELIGRDQALAVRTLRLANSAFYGVSGRVGSVRDAVHLLGRRALCSVLTLASVSQQFQPAHCPPFSFNGFWRHALATAMAARAIARLHNLDEEQAFTVGLLHDVGRLALATYFPAAMAAALLRAQADDAALHDVEHALLGSSHIIVGRQVAQQWHFPPEVVAAIEQHHAPPVAAGVALADIVHVADAVAHALDLAFDAHECVPDVDPGAWHRAVPVGRALLAVFAEVEAGVAALAGVLDLQSADDHEARP